MNRACWLCVSIPLVIAKFGDTEGGHAPEMADAAMAELQEAMSTVTELLKRQTEEIHTLQTEVHKLSTKTATGAVFGVREGSKNGDKTSEPLVLTVDVPVTQMASEY